jgi:23S rRNA pseudouridine2605 synthase
MRPRSPRAPGRARGRSTPPVAEAPGERIQKVLAAAGLGSRREIERWIEGGRLLVNGSVPQPGTKLTATDRITLDGRPVRLRNKSEEKGAHLLLLHRSPGSALDLKDAAARAADHLETPRASRRWLAVQPLPPVDGGLEILTDDGALQQRISRGVHALTTDFVLRVRGALTQGVVEDLKATTEVEGESMNIIEANAQFGEGLNHWLNVTVRATRPAQVRHWLAARGIIVSRLIRIRFGPVHLSRELPRGHLREMSISERNALMNEVDAAQAALALERTAAEPIE